jgi:hypothetical protein
MRLRKEYRINLIGGKDANGNTIMPEDFTPEALASRTPEEVESDDISLWFLVYLTGMHGPPSFAHLEGVGDCEEIEARNCDNPKFLSVTEKIREVFRDLDSKFD